MILRMNTYILFVVSVLDKSYSFTPRSSRTGAPMRKNSNVVLDHVVEPITWVVFFIRYPEVTQTNKQQSGVGAAYPNCMAHGFASQNGRPSSLKAS